MIIQGSPNSAGSDALALVQLAVDPERTRARIEELTKLEQSIVLARDDARRAEYSAKQEREAAKALLADISKRETAVAAREVEVAAANAILQDRSKDLAHREAAFASEMSSQEQRIKLADSKSAEVAKAASQRNASAERDAIAAAALRTEFESKVRKLREFLASLG